MLGLSERHVNSEALSIPIETASHWVAFEVRAQVIICVVIHAVLDRLDLLVSQMAQILVDILCASDGWSRDPFAYVPYVLCLSKGYIEVLCVVDILIRITPIVDDLETWNYVRCVYVVYLFVTQLYVRVFAILCVVNVREEAKQHNEPVEEEGPSCCA